MALKHPRYKSVSVEMVQCRECKQDLGMSLFSHADTFQFSSDALCIECSPTTKGKKTLYK